MTMLPPPPRLVDKPLRIDVVRPLEVISSTHRIIRIPAFCNPANAIVQVNESEEDDLLNLLNDMCSNPLLIDQRLRDEDFHIFSLVRERARKLGNSPLTPDSALFYLELPHTVLMADAIQPLTIAAKKYLAAQYKDITRFREEVIVTPGADEGGE